jgi:hypothetical protein
MPRTPTCVDAYPRSHARTGGRGRGLLGATFFLLLVVSSRAEADGAAAVPDIQYLVPAGCPDEPAFRARLDARVASASKEAVQRSLRGLSIRIAKSPEGYSGQLTVLDADAASSVREVSAPTCNEIVDAFAILSALTMGIVSSGPLLPPPPSPPLAPPPLPTLPPRGPPPSSPTTVGATSDPAKWRFSVGADAAMVSFVGPSVGFGPEPFLEVRHESPGLVSPALRLSGTRIGGETATASGGSASLSLTTLRLDLCPIRLRLASRLGISPCAGARAGAIEGSASKIVLARQEADPWFSLEALARLDWLPFDWLVFELQGGVSIPFFRYDFYFAPSAGLYETPPVGAVVGAGVGVRFP